MGEITRETFKPYIQAVFKRCYSRLEDGWDRAMLEREFTPRGLDCVMHMHEQDYAACDGTIVPKEDLPAAFWGDLHDWWLAWNEPERIEGQPRPRPGMWIQRKGQKPVQVKAYHPKDTFRVMPGDETLGWVTTLDGKTSADGSYRVLGYR